MINHSIIKLQMFEDVVVTLGGSFKNIISDNNLTDCNSKKIRQSTKVN